MVMMSMMVEAEAMVAMASAVVRVVVGETTNRAGGPWGYGHYYAMEGTLPQVLKSLSVCHASGAGSLLPVGPVPSSAGCL